MLRWRAQVGNIWGYKINIWCDGLGMLAYMESVKIARMIVESKLLKMNIYLMLIIQTNVAEVLWVGSVWFMEFDGIAEGCQLGDCLIRPNPKRSMKNWRNNDGPSCAQKSAGMGGIGWGGVQMRFPRRFSAASHWVGQSGVLVGRLHFRMPTLQSLILIFFNFFKFAPFPSLRRVTSCQEGGCNCK